MKSTARLAGRIVLFLAGWGVLAVLPALLGDVSAFSAVNPAAARLVREVLALGVAVLLSGLCLRMDGEGFRLPALIGEKPGEGLLLGGGIGVLLAGGALAVLKAGGLMSFRSQLKSLDGMGIWLLALLCRAAWMAALCCGYLFTLLQRRFGAAGALVGSMALYLLLCTRFWEAGPLAAANGLAIGLLLGLLRLQSGGVAASAAAAFLWNFAAGFLFNCLPLTGYPSLTEVALEGPALLTGGGNGLNGSLVTLGAALACSGILIAARLRAGRKVRKAGA